ncbi:MAG: nucleotidyltransferase domain-containing protein [Clostridiales bacterium]|jgi:predicted nucleotidyltransferase|nr:nucleotidyltransferase domain-containing protein [Clostridiales bacterium]
MDNIEIACFIHEILANNPRVQQAVLFGSRAMGANTERSDIDIALFGDFTWRDVEKIRLACDALPLPYKFDVVDYNAINNLALKRHIDSTGVLLYKNKNYHFTEASVCDRMV